MYVFDIRSIGSTMTMGPWASEPNGEFDNIYQIRSGKYVATCTRNNTDLLLASHELVGISEGKLWDVEPISPSEKRLAEEVEDSVDAMLFISDLLTDLACQLDPEEDLEVISLLDNCSAGLRDPAHALAWKKSLGK